MALNWQTEYHRYRRYFINIGRFYQQKKARVYTELVLSVFVTAFFLFFAIKPTVVTITGLIKEIKDRRAVAEKLEEKIKALSLAQGEYRTIQSDLYLVDQALPKDSRLPTLVKQIEALALKTGTNIEIIQYSSVGLRGKFNPGKQEAAKFTMNLAGEYQNLKNFLLSLGSLRRVVTLESFGFKDGRKEAQELTLTFSAKAFFLEEDK